MHYLMGKQGCLEWPQLEVRASNHPVPVLKTQNQGQINMGKAILERFSWISTKKQHQNKRYETPQWVNSGALKWPQHEMRASNHLVPVLKTQKQGQINTEITNLERYSSISVKKKKTKTKR